MPTATCRPAPPGRSPLSKAATRPEAPHDRALDQILHSLGVRESALADPEIFLQAQGDDQLPLREEPDLAPFPRRACAAPLSEWRGALYRVQIVRGGVGRASCRERSGQ